MDREEKEDGRAHPALSDFPDQTAMLDLVETPETPDKRFLYTTVQTTLCLVFFFNNAGSPRPLWSTRCTRI